ncbi:MAG: hypothetical protein F4Y86_01440, partial [Gammaproteobacteria bacterium]|nr:hypothetical protein [Gammaproteobacteria bacterium]
MAPSHYPTRQTLFRASLADRSPAVYAVIEAARQASGKSMMSYLIFMAVRLLELHRVLKETGSIYLHCDDAAGHYLKLLMDAVFGADGFRAAITWKRTSAHSDTKQGRRQHGRIHDLILFYTRSKSWTWNPVYTDYDPSYVDSFYRHKDANGRRYRKDNLTAAKPGGDTSYEWRVRRPAGGEWEADLDDEWVQPKAGWEYKGVQPYRGRYWAYSKAGMREYAQQHRIAYARTGMPNYKRYLDEMPGVPLQDVWTDIPIALGKERLGYPTQKPLALLERIIKASSNEGDMVLDPFCGCATTLVAADRLQRKWAGIDLSPLAVKLVNDRITHDQGLWGGATVQEEPPKRTDQGKLPNYRTHRHRLYGVQEGVCMGCDTHFPFRVMDVDHILPRARGGTDHPDNLQLLCSGCNRSKGGRTMAEWRAAQALANL